MKIETQEQYDAAQVELADLNAREQSKGTLLEDEANRAVELENACEAWELEQGLGDETENEFDEFPADNNE